MKFTMGRGHSAATLALGAARVGRSQLLAALLLVAAMLAASISGHTPADATAAATPGPAADLPVGHTVKRILVKDSADPLKDRQVDVHLWYPAEQQNLAEAPKRKKTIYTSGLYGHLLPEPWKPLSWTVRAKAAREGAAIDPNGPAFPVIVFSHGSVNDPIDYAHTLELIAGAGFVVAAPSHVNNTQDDVRIDYINGQAGYQLIACNDGRPPPCSRTNVPFSMADRVKDISMVLDTLPKWLGDRVNVSRAGVLGHSRGTVSVLAAAGGSAERNPEAICQPTRPDDGNLCWPLAPEPRVKAVMGLAIAVRAITLGANPANIRVPTLLVAGTRDATSPQWISEEAFGKIATMEKTFVSIKNATHRSFDSTYCDQTQAAGAVFDENVDGVVDDAELANTRVILDRHTITGIVTHPTSGKAMDYCSYATFTYPTDITRLIADLTKPDSFIVTEDNVPTTDLDSDKVKKTVENLAVTFFGKWLKNVG